MQNKSKRDLQGGDDEDDDDDVMHVVGSGAKVGSGRGVGSTTSGTDMFKTSSSSSSGRSSAGGGACGSSLSTNPLRPSSLLDAAIKPNNKDNQGDVEQLCATSTNKQPVNHWYTQP